jgi:preprotein translocase subunit SecD
MSKRFWVLPAFLIALVFMCSSCYWFWGAGIDSRGGIRLVYDADLSNTPAEERDSALKKDLGVLRRRLVSLGYSRAQVTAGEGNQIRVEIPGQQKITPAFDLLGRTGLIEFGERTTDMNLAKWFVEFQMWKPALGTLNGKPAALSSAYFKNNVHLTNYRSDYPVLAFEWTSDGSSLSKEITGRLYQDNQAQLGIFCGLQMICSPTVKGIIVDKGIIEGLSQSEAVQLRDLINAGYLPVPLKLVENTLVNPPG